MNEELPLISVVIPHFKQPEHLRRCLEALAAQSYPREKLEVIVVDNGSTELPDVGLEALPGVRLEEEPTPGPGPARNRGAALARGAILAFIDADCVPDADWLAAIARRFKAEEPRVILGGDVRIAYRDPNHLTALEAYESVFGYRQKMYVTRMGFSGTLNLAVRRDDFESVGPFRGIEFAEDREWGKRAMARGFRIRYVPEMIVYHPARETFAELCAKWDRHIQHDSRMHRDGGRTALSWVLRSIAVGLSPLAHTGKVFASPHVRGPRATLLAFVILTRIRLYRAWKMLRLVWPRRQADFGGDWSRT